MATVPAPRTWTVGELLTAAKLNTDLRDGLNFLLAPPLAVLRKTASQSITTGAGQAVTWDTEDLDRDASHSTVSNTSRYTANTAGWYRVNARINWASTGTDVRGLYFKKNGGGDLNIDQAYSAGGVMQGDLMISLTVSDYVEVWASQGTGASINIISGQGNTTHFEVAWISTT